MSFKLVRGGRKETRFIDTALLFTCFSGLPHRRDGSIVLMIRSALLFRARIKK